MKTPLNNLPKEKAQKELHQFAVLGLALSAVGLVIFAWIGIAGLAFSTRALVLSSHPGNAGNPKKKQYVIMAVAGVVLGILDAVALFAN
jgi:hypothetical protein